MAAAAGLYDVTIDIVYYCEPAYHALSLEGASVLACPIFSQIEWDLTECLGHQAATRI